MANKGNRNIDPNEPKIRLIKTADHSEDGENARKAQAKTSLGKAKRRRKFVNTIMGIIVFCGLLGCLSGFTVVKLCLSKTDVELNIEDLGSTDSSIIYDENGNQIALIGSESRINYSYLKIPQVVIDAFISVEDSRFFEHVGFDLPRFAKAILENIRSLSFAQGGSTLTMQVIKNTYFSVDTTAEKSIGRKIQEIYYSIKINNIVSKEKILELYINKVNYGATSRGIQVAAQYYFGKNASELSLVEAAMLAGVVNRPNKTNPYLYPTASNERTRTVLYQMHNHGYISDTEYAIAKKVDITNLLVGTTTQKYGQGVTVSNQAYIDIVLAELEETYNINPYLTPVKVYTAMNQAVQNYCDELSRGNVVTFQDDYINTSIAAIRNFTGEIIGVCAGRDYDSEKMFNYAYDNRVNIGSTAKAIFTYPLAFEYGGLGTNWYGEDEPMAWKGTTNRIKEDGGYSGVVSTQRAFTSSYNVIAVKLFYQVKQMAGLDIMKSYLKSIGVDASIANGVNEQYAIGEQGFQMSPIQLAAAESAILSNGIYTEPHTITKIEYINSTHEPIIVNLIQSQVMSEAASWLTCYLQGISVNGGATADDWKVKGRLSYIKKSKYTVYGKTGTHLYDSTVVEKYGLPTWACKDWLQIGGTNDYSYVFWMGYDTGQHLDSNCYVNDNTMNTRQDGKVINGLLNTITEQYGIPKNIKNMPSTVVSFDHLKGVYPYVSLPEYADEKYQVTSLIKQGYDTVGNYDDTVEKLSALTSFTGQYYADSASLVLNYAVYPDETLLTIEPDTIDYTWENEDLTVLNWTGKRVYSRTWIEGTVEYNCDIKNLSTNESQHYSFSYENPAIIIENDTDQDITYEITGYYAFSISKSQSSSVKIQVIVPAHTTAPYVPPTDPPTDPPTE